MTTFHQVFLFLEGGILVESNSSGGSKSSDLLTNVLSGDTVEWLPGDNSGILSISNIYTNEDVLFSGVPETQGIADMWSAGIDAPPSEYPYSYFIEVVPKGHDGTVLKFDPKIKVHIPPVKPD